MQISQLWNKYKGKEGYIIGTGPSLRLFPSRILANKFTIGLNEAWKFIDCNYNLTIHPELIPRDYKERKQNWITKVKGWINKEEPLYLFQNNRDVKNYDYLTSLDDTLYVSRGIHTAGIVLGAKMGLSCVYLVGVDCHTAPSNRAAESVTDDFQKTPQEDYNSHSNIIQTHGQKLEDVCREYYLAGIDVAQRVKAIYGMEVINLSPYFAPAYWKEEHQRLSKDLPVLPEPKDVSKYAREKLDFH